MSFYYGWILGSVAFLFLSDLSSSPSYNSRNTGFEVKKKIDLSNYKLALPVVFLLIAFTGSALIAKATTWGPWAFSDSAAYISSARNFNIGLGLSLRNADGTLEPLDVFPPLYPLSLGLLARMGLGYLFTARCIDSLLFGLFLIIFSWGIHSILQSYWVTLFSSLLLLFSPLMIEHFSGVMTEPLFFIISYAAIFITFRYTQQRKMKWLISAIALTGISTLMKHVGLVTCAVNTLTILMLDSANIKKRFVKSLLFGSLSLIPIMAWFGMTYANNQTLGGRSLDMSPDVWNRFQDFFSKMASIFQSWVPYSGYRVQFFPDPTKIAITLIIVATIVCAGFTLFIRQRKNQSASSKHHFFIMLITAMIISIHILAVCLIQIFTYPKMDLIGRFFIPILPAIILLITTSSSFLIIQLSAKYKKHARIMLFLAGILLVRYYFLVTNSFINERAANGFGYTAREIQTSGFLQAVQQIPAETTLIANTPALTLLYTNRMPYPLDFIPTVPLGTRSMEIDQIFVNRKAALILDYASIRNVYPDWKERLTYFTRGLDVVYKDDIGGIYFFPE